MKRVFVVVFFLLLVFSFGVNQKAEGETASSDAAILCHDSLDYRGDYSPEKSMLKSAELVYKNLYNPPYLKYRGSLYFPSLPPDPVVIPLKPRLILPKN
jgi:hypothetical protein